MTNTNTSEAPSTPTTTRARRHEDIRVRQPPATHARPRPIPHDLLRAAVMLSAVPLSPSLSLHRCPPLRSCLHSAPDLHLSLSLQVLCHCARLFSWPLFAYLAYRCPRAVLLRRPCLRLTCAFTRALHPPKHPHPLPSLTCALRPPSPLSWPSGPCTSLSNAPTLFHHSCPRP